MIRSGRQPRTPGERMIFNNHAGMEELQTFRRMEMTPEIILHLHHILTIESLPPEESGRYRREHDAVHIIDPQGNVLFVPPDASEISQRIEELCLFANDRNDGGDGSTFIHPIVRSIILHFWLAYIHPFIDGNGRTARLLFYWSMMRHGNDLTEYISISSILRAAPARYAASFLYVETDENDLTYFVLNQLETILRAIDQLKEYIVLQREKKNRIGELVERYEREEKLNRRQRALLGHALEHPGYRYTITGHQRSQGIVYQTARNDLLSLVDQEFLRMEKHGRRFTFVAPEDLESRLQGE